MSLCSWIAALIDSAQALLRDPRPLAGILAAPLSLPLILCLSALVFTWFEGWSFEEGRAPS